MGLFGGKKKNTGTTSVEGSDRLKPAAQKSRRVLVPGGAGKAQAPAPAPTPARPAAQAPAAPAKPGSARVPAAPQPANGQPAAKSGPRPTAKPGSEPTKTAPSQALMIGSDRATPAVGSATAVGRPPSRQPITESRPPDFAGGLGSATRGGPCRTGDNALIEFLISKAHLLTADQAENVRKKAGQDNMPIDAAAVFLGFLSEEQLVNALTQECWVPHLRVDKYEIRKKALDTIGRDDATHYGVFPVDKLGSLLTLAMVNPLDAETIRVLEAKTSLDIKKVVATRTEIAQGIDKYYSGLVQAKDTSLSFTQDAEVKSVTQMLSKVQVSDGTKSSSPLKQVGAKPAPSAARPSPALAPTAGPSKIRTPLPSIVPEIEDIDDLLAGDEVIAPAIIEPVTIDPLAIEPDSIELLEPESLVKNQALAPIISPNPVEPVAKMAPPKVAPPKAAPAPKGAPEMLDFDVDIAVPAKPTAQPAAAPPKPEPVRPVTTSARPPAASPAAAKPPVAPPARPAPAPAVTKPTAPSSSGAHRGTGTTSRPGTRSIARPSAAPAVVNLIPVMEEEFQHAITHGKAHVFEKWVSLQSRNRIINGVAIEEELDDLLAGLYASAKRVG